MKQIVAVALICMAVNAYSQQRTFDAMIVSNPFVGCQDVQSNAKRLIKGMYDRNQPDSVYKFISYWEEKCGKSELTFRITLIMDAITGRFNEENIDELWIINLSRFQNFENRTRPDLEQALPVSSWDLMYLSIDQYFIDLASYAPRSSSLDQNLLLNFYASKSPSFDEIANAPQDQSKLSRLYHQRRQLEENYSTTHVGLSTGIYQPFGRISLFGIRPTLGILLGTTKNRHTVDFSVDVQMGPSRSEYTVRYQDTLRRVKTWTGAYIGLEYAYDIIRTPKYAFSLSPGIGYNAFTAVKENEDRGEESKSISSYNFNGGIQFKYYYSKYNYVGIQAKYNLVDYRNPGGTDLSGDYFSLKVIWVGGAGEGWSLHPRPRYITQ